MSNRKRGVIVAQVNAHRVSEIKWVGEVLLPLPLSVPLQHNLLYTYTVWCGVGLQSLSCGLTKKGDLSGTQEKSVLFPESSGLLVY